MKTFALPLSKFAIRRLQKDCNGFLRIFYPDQAAHSVGTSHESYRFGGKQWTLATDAATPIATWRPDLLKQYGISRPQTRDKVLALARSGFVTVSALPIDVLTNSYMFCEALGETPFSREDVLASERLS